MPQAAELATDALFTQYLDVVNRALNQNRNTFPYQQMLAAGKKVLDQSTVAVGIYKDDIDAPHDWFSVQFDDGRFSLEAHGKEDTDFKWMIREAHLEEVVDHPDGYVESPYKLNLDWLKRAAKIDA